MDSCKQSANSNTKSPLEKILDDNVYNLYITALQLTWASFSTVHGYDMN